MGESAQLTKISGGAAGSDAELEGRAHNVSRATQMGQTKKVSEHEHSEKIAPAVENSRSKSS